MDQKIRTWLKWPKKPEPEKMAAASAAQPSSSSSFIFFTKQHKTHLHNLIHFPLRRRFTSSASAKDSSTSSNNNNNNNRRRRRKWDSNAETIRGKDFNFKEEEDDYYDYDYDYDEDIASSGILEEVLDSIWIFKVFKSFGWALPPILLSLFFATGPKAFLTALALPLGQSLITFAFEKVSGMSRSKQKRKASVRRTKKYTSRRSVRNDTMEEEVHEGPKNRKGMKGYQSWVVDDDSLNEGDRSTTSFGGWDELDGMGSTKMPLPVENEPKRTTKTNEKLSMERIESNEPLLLRLLIAVFPILGSWTRLFW